MTLANLGPLVFLLWKTFRLLLPSNMLALSVPNDCYCRNASCVLNLIPTFLLHEAKQFMNTVFIWKSDHIFNNEEWQSMQSIVQPLWFLIRWHISLLNWLQWIFRLIEPHLINRKWNKRAWFDALSFLMSFGMIH